MGLLSVPRVAPELEDAVSVLRSLSGFAPPLLFSDGVSEGGTDCEEEPLFSESDLETEDEDVADCRMDAIAQVRGPSRPLSSTPPL